MTRMQLISIIFALFAATTALPINEKERGHYRPRRKELQQAAMEEQTIDPKIFNMMVSLGYEGDNKCSDNNPKKRK